MARIIGYCGVDCTVCEAYIATQDGDEAEKERIAARWRQKYHNPKIDAAYVTCDGCLTHSAYLGGYCLDCPIRRCGHARGVFNCACCPEYPCDTLVRFFKLVPTAQATLEQIYHPIGHTNYSSS